MIHLHEKRYEYQEEVNEGILRHVPAGREDARALDIGCGSGALSLEITGRGYSVWGIESNPEAAAKAARRIDRVIPGDLQDRETVDRETEDHTFDLLIFSDVLEHVYDPLTVLRSYLPKLNEGGLLLISVPNFTVWTNRLKVLFGNFRYMDTGVRDRTHIRFFTYKSATEVVEAAGCDVVKVDCTPYFVRAALPQIKKLYRGGGGTSEARMITDSRGYSLYMKYLYPLELAVARLRMSLFAFRIVIVGKKR